MRFILCFVILILLLHIKGFSQINLVPNPSFEDTIRCPIGVPDLDGACKNWQSFRGTPDYFNQCSGSIGFTNPWGFQIAKSGNAYAGFGNYAVTNPNAHEQFGIELLNPLAIGEKYYLSFFISTAYTPLQMNICSNLMGVKLTTYQYFDQINFPLPNNATIKVDSILRDTLNWIKIFGSFIADSAYKYLVIGSFYDDSQIDTLHLPYSIVPQASYYYVDDVCLSTDSVYSQVWSEILELPDNNEIKIFPNPGNGNFYISSDSRIDEIQIYNVLGQIINIIPEQLGNAIHFDMTEFVTGIYLIRTKVNSKYANTLIQKQ